MHIQILEKGTRNVRCNIHYTNTNITPSCAAYSVRHGMVTRCGDIAAMIQCTIRRDEHMYAHQLHRQPHKHVQHVTMRNSACVKPQHVQLATRVTISPTTQTNWYLANHAARHQALATQMLRMQRAKPSNQQFSQQTRQPCTLTDNTSSI